MNLTRLLGQVVLITSGCASTWAQTAPLAPAPIVPKPFQFDASQYKLLLPNRPVTVMPGGSVTPALRIVSNVGPDNRPCAVARIVRPNPVLDPGMIGQNSGPAPMPIEAHSHDLAEMNAPAALCADIAAPEKL